MTKEDARACWRQASYICWRGVVLEHRARKAPITLSTPRNRLMLDVILAWPEDESNA